MKKFIFLLIGQFLIISFSGCIPAIVGTAATSGMISGSQDRKFSEIKSDLKIWTSIKNQFVQYNSKDLFKNVNVNVINGRVLLSGDVQKPNTKILAEKISWVPSGVKEVINEIYVNKDYTPKDGARDSTLAIKVKARLALERDIKSNNYKIEVSDSVVYVIGTTKSEEELSRALELISKVAGVKRVINYVTIR
jgi:osmotically-inducible protein OsmY